MANAFANPPTLPDPTELSTGQTLRGQPSWQAVAETMNWCHAHAQAGHTLVSDGWADDMCAWSGAAQQAIHGWRVPMISPLHVTAYCIVRAKATGAGGTVTLTSSAGNLVLAVAAGAWADYTGVLALPAAGTYDDITMELATAAPDVVTVDSVDIYPEPLTSPLAATAAGTIRPFGATTAGSDYPLPGAIGHQAVDAQQALLDRPRALFCRSGLNAAIGTYTGHGGETWAPFPHRQPIIVHPGAEARGRTHTVWVKVRSGGAATKLWWQTANDPLWPLPTNQVDIGAGLGDFWKSFSVTIPEEPAALDRFDDLAARRGVDADGVLRIGLWTDTGHGTPGISTATILAASMWGF